MLISPEYKKLLQKTHEQSPKFGHAGNKAKDVVLELCAEYHTQDVLDYGCGKGMLAKFLDFPIQSYDPGVPRFSKLPKPADIVICRDVLEHVEEECIEDVLDHLQSLIQRVGWFVIVFAPSLEVLADGANAHLLQRDRHWWLEQLEKRWSIKEFRLRGHREAKVIVEPKDGK